MPAPYSVKIGNIKSMEGGIFKNKTLITYYALEIRIFFSVIVIKLPSIIS